tara:strand:- start:249 stop:452 length:204 start_codon:yes stop_codon:yes gene_type:complete
MFNPQLSSDVIKTMLDGFKDSDWGPCSKLSPKEVFCMPGTWSDVITREEFDNDRAKVFSKNNPNPGS